MTFGELRLCVRWQRRDSRYLLRGAPLAPAEVQAVRAWRIDEAVTIGSVPLTTRAASWTQ